METYLVGGAVRDELLGRDVKERDWVVVGGSPQEMLAANYKAVGKDFPVFLHPKTHEEYALARTERKTAPGYHGFQFHAAPDVTLEEDLQRRDLTMNAIAKDEHGELTDPFHGQQDIEQRLIRHVSDAFAEDPVRILRAARFAARFHAQGFRIADETLALMRNMVESGEADALVSERVWAETHKALCEDRPSVFFEALRQCGALQRLFPELEKLYGVPQPEKWHPEIDTGVHTMMVLDQAARLTTEPKVRFAALIHDLGKGSTPKDILPSHHGHEERSVKLVKALCKRLRAPSKYCELAVHVARFHGHYHRINEMRPNTIVKTLSSLDAFRQPERFQLFLLACEADSRGRTGYEDITPPQTAQFQALFEAANGINSKPFIATLEGNAIGKAIFKERVAAVAQTRTQ